MLLCPFSQCQRDKFRTIIHTQHDRITAVCRDPVEHTDHSRSWQIQIYFNRQRLTVKVINNIERAKMTPTDQASCIKSTDQLWFSASGVASGEDYAPAAVVYPYGENSASADNKYGGSFCDSTRIPAAAEPEKLRKTLSWIPFSCRLQYGNNGFVMCVIRTVMINRSAQIVTPAGLTDTESECRYQMSDQLTLKG